MGGNLLRAIPKGYRTDLALIIAPYFDTWFVENEVNELKPRRVRFLLDNGARSDEVDGLRKACLAPDVRIGLGHAPGLVHLKLFYLELMPNRGAGPTRRLVWFGSANATEAAIGGERKAELVAEAEVKPKAELLRYINAVLQAIEAGTGKVEYVHTKPTADLPKLHLPGFRVRDVRPLPGFDAWLQRGTLAAKYRDLQQFMKVSLKLLKPLPPGDIASVFADQGLTPEGTRDMVRFSYVDDGGRTTDESSENEQWKSKYAIWTCLGDWLSEECFVENERILGSKSHYRRKKAIDGFLKDGADPRWVGSKRADFSRKLEATLLALERTGARPSDFIRLVLGRVDAAEYGALFDQKVKTDLQWARDSSFYNRYISGYEFVPVPKFRQDVSTWDEFVASWCDSVLLEAKKGRRYSLIAKHVEHVLKRHGCSLRSMNSMEVADQLRQCWNNQSVGSYVWAKYDDWYYHAQVRDHVRNLVVVDYEDGDTAHLVEGDVSTCGKYISKYFDTDKPYDYRWGS